MIYAQVEIIYELAGEIHAWLHEKVVENSSKCASDNENESFTRSLSSSACRELNPLQASFTSLER